MATPRPIKDHVLLHKVDPDPFSNGLHGKPIFVPEGARESTKAGTVLAISEDLENVPFGVGDTVYFVGYAGVPVKYEGEDYLFMLYADLVAWQAAQKQTQ